MATVKKYSQKIEITAGYTCGGDDQQYKCWGGLDNLKTANGLATCHGSDNLIAGKNGTYKQPAPLTFNNFGFDLSDNYTVTKVELHYKTQKFINGGYYPDIGGATIKLLGTNQANKTGKAVSQNKIEDIITWTGVTVAQVNSTQFGVQIAFPQNESTTPGYINLEDVYLLVYYEDNSTKLTLESSFSSNPVTVGEQFELTCTVRKTSSASYNRTTYIDLPLGVSPSALGTADGTVTVSTITFENYTFKRLTWKHNMAEGSQTDYLSYVCRADTPSSNFAPKDTNRPKQCIITDVTTKISTTNYLTIKDISVTVSTNLYANKVSLRAGKGYKAYATIKINDPSQTNKALWVGLNNGATLDNSEISFTGYLADGYNTSNSKYWIRFEQNKNEMTIKIPLKVVAPESGTYKMTLFVTNSGQTKHLSPDVTVDFLARGSDLGQLAFTRIKVPEVYTQNMGDGIPYTFGSQVKYILKNNKYGVEDHGDNLRIGVYNNSEAIAADEDEFVSEIIWCDKMATTNSEERSVKFTYNAEYPLYLVYSHDYSEDAVNPFVTMNFSEPWIVETGYYPTTPIRDLRIYPVMALCGNTKYCWGEFTPSIEKTVPVACYDWNDGGILKQDIGVLGIEVLFDYNVSEEVTCLVELYLGWSVRGTRDIIISKGSGTARAGDSYDLFGFKPSDFVGRLNALQVRLQIFNQDSSKPEIEINNLRMNVRYVNPIHCGYGLSVDGEKSQYYGFVVTDVEHNSGTKNERTLYQVPGTDNTVINRLNVESKDISINIVVPECNLKNTFYLIDRIVDLFTNERELNSNKPILKKLVFDHIPDREFRFVRVDSFDDEIKGNSYYAKIKLEIPDGTTYAIQETITGAHGQARSTIFIKPVIVYKANAAGKLVITEKNLGQEFIVNSNKIKEDSIITIDSENRTVMLGNTNITNSVDYNSTWFRLKGEYAFSSTTGTVRSVSFNVRR